MTGFDERTLVAFVDGELEGDRARAVADAVARDPRLAAAVETLRRADDLVRAAFDGAAWTPLPPLTLGPPAVAVPLRLRPAAAPRPRRWLMPALAAALAGLLVGAGLGRYALPPPGDTLAELDRQLQASALMRSLESEVSGSTVAWENPETGSRGTVRLIRSFRSGADQYCREFEQNALIGGAETVIRGIACRDAEAGWRTRVQLVQS
jgi:surface antigen